MILYLYPPKKNHKLEISDIANTQTHFLVLFLSGLSWHTLEETTIYFLFKALRPYMNDQGNDYCILKILITMVN